MKKKIIIFLLALITVINILAAALLFIDIQIIQTPEITVKIDVIEINPDEVVLQTTIDIDNPNSFGFITKNLEVSINTPGGDEVAHVLIEGGSVPPNEKKTFTADAFVSFDGNSPKLLTTRITGSIGVNIVFIEKTLPITVNIVTSMDEVIKDLTRPIIHIQAEFGEITQESINITGGLDVYNPNTFDMSIGDFSVDIKTETGSNVGNLNIPGGTIKAKDSTNFSGKGLILIEALNAKKLLVNISGAAGAKIAGFNKSIPFSVEAEIKLPDIGELLSSHLPTDLVIKADFKASATGLISDITLEVHNPNKIALAAKDIIVSMYRVDNEEELLINTGNLEGGVVEAETVGFFKGQLVLPYTRLLIPRGGNTIPDWMKIGVRANVSIPGINQSLCLGLIGYQDFHLFR